MVDYGDGLLWDADYISIDFACTVEIKKKDDLTELTNRIAALESLLGLFGAATASVAGTNGLIKGAEIGEQGHLLRGDRTWQNPSTLPITSAATAAINSAVASLVASSPSTLDTLNELAVALGNDPNFATTIINSLAGKAPINSPIFTGFTTLGDNVAVKKKRLTGSTAATQGGETNILHGLTASKITGVQVVIQLNSAFWITDKYANDPGYRCECYYDLTHFSVVNVLNDSAGILSKPFYAVIEYIQ